MNSPATAVNRPRVLLLGRAPHRANIRSRLSELGFECVVRDNLALRSNREATPEAMPVEAPLVLLVGMTSLDTATKIVEAIADAAPRTTIFGVSRPDAPELTPAALRAAGVQAVFCWPRDDRALVTTLIRLLHDRCERPAADVALEEHARAQLQRCLPYPERARIHVHAHDGVLTRMVVTPRVHSETSARTSSPRISSAAGRPP